MKTIAELRRAGYKVKIEHFRQLKPNQYVPYSRKTKGAVNDKGGFTVATVTNPIGETSKAVAFCSQEESFVYKTGVEIALGRAMA